MTVTRFPTAGCLAAKLSAPALLLLLTACVSAAGAAHQLVPEGLQYLVVIYLENHSFDNLYGEFPGANGLANAGATATQVDLAGKKFVVLPTPPGGAFPNNLPNG